MVQSCHYRARRREDCCDGQVERRAGHQCENKKQRTSMFHNWNRFKSNCLVVLEVLKWCTNFCFRALRAVTVSPPAKRRRTFCHLTRSKSREKGSAKGRGNERKERWRDADPLGKYCLPSSSPQPDLLLIKNQFSSFPTESSTCLIPFQWTR